MTQLKLRLTKLEEYWIEFDKLLMTIEREQFEGLYFIFLDQAQIYIGSYGKSGLTSLNQPTYFTNLRARSFKPYSENNQIGINLPQVKLPKINVPSFLGNYEDWLSFSDSFDS